LSRGVSRSLLISSERERSTGQARGIRLVLGAVDVAGSLSPPRDKPVASRTVVHGPEFFYPPHGRQSGFEWEDIYAFASAALFQWGRGRGLFDLKRVIRWKIPSEIFKC